MDNINFGGIKKIHIIGIEGAGTSALARILKLSGKEISGSDEGDHFYFGVLEKEGIGVFHKFSPENIPSDVDLIIYGSSFRPETNVELKAAFDLGKTIITYAEALALMFNAKYGIAVVGTHGKTTTSAMLAEIMRSCEVDPSAVIGGKVINWDSNSIAGKGEFFVAEADEYQNKLKYYEPKSVILTSCDFDHPDFFKDFAEYKKVFSDFVSKIPKIGTLIVWGDSVDTLEVSASASCSVLTYGFSEDCIYKSKIKNQKSKTQVFEIFFKEELLGEFETQLTGKHNVLNATAAIAMCHKLNIDMEKVKEAVLKFRGTARRFQYVGERNGAIIIDDYAHHPEEIKATLRGAREIYPEKNILAIFHPHTFTRTKALLGEFSQSFDDADKVIVLDIFGSARETQGGVSSKELVNLINKYTRDKAEYVPTIDEVIEYLENRIGENDIIITIGAGDVWQVAKKLVV